MAAARSTSSQGPNFLSNFGGDKLCVQCVGSDIFTTTLFLSQNSGRTKYIVSPMSPTRPAPLNSVPAHNSGQQIETNFAKLT